MTTNSASRPIAATQDRPSGASLGGLLRRPEAGAFLGLLAVLIFFAAFGGLTFLKPAGMASWLNVAANLGIIAIPVGLLMIAGELDISVGAMVPFGAMTVAVIAGHYGLPIWLGIVVTLGFGVTVGLINGIMVIRTAVPSLIVTLGTLFAVQGMLLGLTVLVTKSTNVALTTEGAAKSLFGDFISFGGLFPPGQLQVIVLWWLVLTAFYVYFLHYSRYGNWILAMGGDKVSARNAGIPTDRMTILLFVLIDPQLSVMTDDVVEGRVSQPEYRRTIVWLSMSRIAGTLLAQAMLVPAAALIVWVAVRV